jgi:hypothetical protein
VSTHQKTSVEKMASNAAKRAFRQISCGIPRSHMWWRSSSAALPSFTALNRSNPYQLNAVTRSFAASVQHRAAEGARVGDHSDQSEATDTELITTEDELHRAMALQSAACNWDKVIELFQECPFEPDKVTLQLAVAGEITVIDHFEMSCFI